MRKKLICFLALIILASIPALFSLGISDFYTSHDGETHTARIANYYLALKEGQFPPQLAPNLFGKLGFPMFIFIYPLPYLVGAVLHGFGFSFTDSFEIVMGMGFLLSAITMFLFTREIFSDEAALLAALFYSWAPYRFSQVYVRGAVAECFAYIFVPLVLLSIFKLTTTGSNQQYYRWIGIGSLSLAALLLSHQLVSLMFLPVIAVFTLVFFLNRKNRKTLFERVIAVGVLGFLASSFIYLPVLLEKKYLQFDQLINYYQEHFVSLAQLIHSKWSYGFSMSGTAMDDMSFQIGLTHILVAALSSGYLLYVIYKNKKRFIKQKLIWFNLAGLGIFFLSVILMLDIPLTRWIWLKLPGLKIIDFPWRLLGVSVFSSSILAAYLINSSKSKPLFLLLVFFVFYANRNHIRINQTLIRNDDYFLNYLETATWKNEFLPVWRSTNRWQNLAPNYRVMQGKIEINDLSVKTDNLLLKLNVTENAKLILHRLYFPGWQYVLDGKLLQQDNFEISNSVQTETANLPFMDESGFPVFVLDSGEHLLAAKFTRTRIRNAGLGLSVISFLAVMVFFLKKKLVDMLKNLGPRR